MTYLTQRQKDILGFIRDFHKRKGIAPTHREICEAFGYSSYGTVHKHLKLLEQKGLIRRDWNQKRGVELVDQDERSGLRSLPLFGTIAAGYPIEVLPETEMIPVPEQLTARGENYVLRVRGDSMIDDGILDGDLVVIMRQDFASNGDMVVAAVNGEVTLKRFYADGQKVRLQPANMAMRPILVNPDEVAIQGIVVGLMRRF